MSQPISLNDLLCVAETMTPEQRQKPLKIKRIQIVDGVIHEVPAGTFGITGINSQARPREIVLESRGGRDTISWDDMLTLIGTATPEEKTLPVIARVVWPDTDEEYPITNIDESEFVLESSSS